MKHLNHFDLRSQFKPLRPPTMACPICRKRTRWFSNAFPDPNHECSICLESNERWVMLNCGHIFHYLCVQFLGVQELINDENEETEISHPNITAEEDVLRRSYSHVNTRSKSQRRT